MVLNQVNNSSNNLKKVFDVYSDKRMKNMEQDRNKMIRQYQICKLIYFDLNFIIICISSKIFL